MQAPDDDTVHFSPDLNPAIYQVYIQNAHLLDGIDLIWSYVDSSDLRYFEKSVLNTQIRIETDPDRLEVLRQIKDIVESGLGASSGTRKRRVKKRLTKSRKGVKKSRKGVKKSRKSMKKRR